MKYSAYEKILFRVPTQSLQNVHRIDRSKLLFEDGIYLSSPNFWFELQLANGKLTEKMHQTLLKYWIRSCMRSTPFGTFAGCFLADINEETALVMNQDHLHRKHVRLDMGFFMDWFNQLLLSEDIREQLDYGVNNSLYSIGDSYRYAEFKKIGNHRKYQLTEIKKNPYIDFVIISAREPQTFSDLHKTLNEHFDVTESETLIFLHGLIDSQILVSNLEPNITGIDPLAKNLDILKRLRGIDQSIEVVKSVLEQLSNPRFGTEYYQEIEQKWKGDPHFQASPKNYMQADLHIATVQANISKEVISKIVSQVTNLKFLSRKNSTPDLEAFKRRFSELFGQQEVPLSLALDSEFGAGYGVDSSINVGKHEFSENLFTSQVTEEPNVILYDHINQFVTKKYLTFLKSNSSTIQINDEDIKEFSIYSESVIYPESIYLLGSLLDSSDKRDHNSFEFRLSGLSGNTAGRLLGRFAFGDDNIHKLINQIVSFEESNDPEAILAELVHLPDDRMGNVLLRRFTRPYEIPYVGKSGVDPANQITLDDLMVSVRDGKIILRSRRLDKKIVTCLTNAHNWVIGSLPIYKMLCDLQLQSFHSYNGWDWGILTGEKWLPRVTYRNIIVSVARWIMHIEDLTELPDSSDSFISYFDNWRKQFSLPQIVVITERGSELLIDFQSIECIKLFISALRKNKELLVEEFIFNKDNCIVKNEAGEPFCNEVIIPLQGKKTEAQTASYLPNTNNAFQVQREFFPGSKWLYFKIYIGNNQANNLLINKLLSYVDNNRDIDFKYFFFLRYFDTANHLRLRFYNDDAKRNIYLQERLYNLVDDYIKDGIIQSIQLDTYERELERYGYDAIFEYEQLWDADSLAMLKFLTIFQGNEERYLWLFAMRSVDLLLDDFTFDLQSKWTILNHLKQSYFNEFGGSVGLQKQLNDIFRQERQFIVSHMEKTLDTINEIEDAVAVFDERSVRNKEIISKIYEKLDTLGVSKISASLIHMSMNRLFTANHRKCELYVYHFLEKYYKSEISLAKKGIVVNKSSSK